MHAATLIYPHQLFAKHPALERDRMVYLIEEPLLLTHNPIHRQRLMLHKLSLDAHERRLTERGHTVIRITLNEHRTTEEIFARLKRDGIKEIHVADTTDRYLERAIKSSSITRVWYESPLFLLARDDAITRYRAAKRSMAHFYAGLRRDWNVLMNDDSPRGGAWSFDDANRKALPKNISLPSDLALYGNNETVAAERWASNVAAEQYGDGGCWLPYTHDGAQKFLEEFLQERFAQFGPYEDAIDTHHTRLFHSTLSPLLNIGLLTPKEVLDAACTYADQHEVPLNSLEGFVRQILGWREFMRASYEADGTTMRTSNYFNHSAILPQAFWDGTTGLDPVDAAIKRAHAYGYTHHIERLMVLGNCMLLLGIHPDEVYRWFMGIYVDAYDWVMVPNVYGMSQFADGGSFATKPYVAGGNYIKKMSNYAGGDWENVLTALYWEFIEAHKETFAKNPRMAMMPRMLDKMDKEKRDAHRTTAMQFRDTLGL